VYIKFLFFINKIQFRYNYHSIEIVVAFPSFSACIYISYKDKDQQAISKKNQSSDDRKLKSKWRPMSGQLLYMVPFILVIGIRMTLD
jgi:hypothetical protein